MAATRDKRANAGNRMATLLENEDTDDFYSSAYGGFEDVMQIANTGILEFFFLFNMLLNS